MHRDELIEVARRVLNQLAREQSNPIAFLSGLRGAVQRLRSSDQELLAAAKDGVELLAAAMTHG